MQLVALLLLGLALTPASTTTLIRKGRQLSESTQIVAKEPANDVLLVSLLDGRMVAVDGATGSVLWTFDSGSPLVSAGQSGLGPAGLHIFPGVDGGLYAYQGLDSGEAKLERLPISLPELVDASPSMTDDGSVVLGKRSSSVFILDRATGQLLRVLSDVPANLNDPADFGLQLPSIDDPSKVVVVGREDFIVRSLQVKSGAESWNATFSRMVQLNTLGPAGMGARLPTPVVGGDPTAAAAAGTPEQLPVRLSVSADNTLQAYSQRSGFRQWAVKFETPPVAAYSVSGPDGNHLLPQAKPQSLPPAGSSAAVHPQLHHSHLTRSHDASRPVLLGQLDSTNTRVLIGAMGSSLYVLPADHITLEPGTDLTLPMTGDAAVAAPLALADHSHQGSNPNPNPFLPSAPETADEPIDGDGSSSKAVAVLGMMTPDDNATAMVSTLVCPTGLHIVANASASSQPVSWLPDAALIRGRGVGSDPGGLAPPPPGPTSLPPRRSAASSTLMALLLGGLLLAGYLVLRWWMGPAAGSSKAAGATATLAMSALPGQQGVAVLAASSASGGKVGSPVKGKRRGKSKGGQHQVQYADGDEEGSVGTSHAPSASGSNPPSDHSRNGKHSNSNGASNVSSNQQQRQDSGGDGTRGSEEVGLPGGRLAQLQPDGSLLIGQLRVGPGILGYGSAGTIVYDGALNGRPVAVKRLLSQFFDLAKKEIDVLIVSDEHPNVVRCFAMEEDREFVYLALERCRAALSDLLGDPKGRAHFVENGQPTARCLEVMRDIAEGLAALHNRGIVHRDLKPHNVLMTDNGRAKLSDMGLSKQLVAEQSSFESHGAGGSSGWQAPEQLIARDGGVVRQTRSMDVFSLGCILFYCITGGKHPFGENYERDTNILRGQPNMALLSGQPEVLNLLQAMLHKDPASRPVMPAVLAHPMWWSADTQLQLLVDVSDRVENEDREPDQTLLNALEAYSTSALGGNWGVALHAELIANLGRYRRYDYTSLRDLLRVIRNKRNHFREMPASLQQLLAPLPGGFLRYFTSRFPNLLLSVFFFALRHLEDDHVLAQYWPCGVQAFQPFFATFVKVQGPKLKPQAAAGSSSAGAEQAMSSSSTADRDSRAGKGNPKLPPIAETASSAGLTDTSSGDAPATELTPQRQVQAGSTDPVATTSAASSQSVIVGYEVSDEPQTDFHVKEFPRREGMQLCDFYVKTGFCKFGDKCIFDHPDEYAVKFTSLNLPQRPSEPVCAFYLKHNMCRFGPSCKFHHPKLRPVYAGSSTQT